MIYDPKRSLGQNFFMNEHLAKKICSDVVNDYTSTIFEIGPGTGVFTHLLQKTNPVIAFEKDDMLFSLLQDHFSTTPHVKLIKMDIMNTSEQLFKELADGEKYRIYGSLPYNISKKIIEKMLLITEAEDFFYIIQKEVADKYVTEKNSIIKARSEVFAIPKVLRKIDRSNFKPQPKVTSSLIRFTRRKEPLIDRSEYSDFTRLLQQSFTSPRKQLHNNLRNTYFENKVANKYARSRPEDIKTEQYIEILRSID